MEVQNKKTEECIYIDEGIGKDDWRFGITKGKSKVIATSVYSIIALTRQTLTYIFFSFSSYC